MCYIKKCRIFIIQAVLIYLGINGCRAVEEQAIFVSRKFFQENCLVNEQNCDGTTSQRPIKDFFSAMKSLLDLCSSKQLPNPSLVEIIFLDYEQDAGFPSLKNNYNISDMCGGVVLKIKSNSRLSIVRFSESNFSIYIPSSLKISNVRFEFSSSTMNINGEKKKK